ncbi:MAG: OmpA family protein [Prochlorothrix sp.]|nr:OmpA family protein [Prochlorothrix sp.]
MQLDVNPSEPQEEEDNSIFLSIGDLMSGLLMIFALLFSVVFIQYQEALMKAEQLKQQVEQYEQAFQQLPLLLRTQLEAELGTGRFEVDPETGDLIIADEILFDENVATLKPAGQAFLRQFIPVYSNIIFQLPPEISRQITTISVEGSTSSSGLDQDNMDLSLSRASSVYQYIFNDPTFPNFPTKAQLRQKMLVAGRGEIDANQQTIAASDRRVTFHFQVRPPTLADFTQSVPSAPSAVPTPTNP